MIRRRLGAEAGSIKVNGHDWRRLTERGRSGGGDGGLRGERRPSVRAVVFGRELMMVMARRGERRLDDRHRRWAAGGFERFGRRDASGGLERVRRRDAADGLERVGRRDAAGDLGREPGPGVRAAVFGRELMSRRRRDRRQGGRGLRRRGRDRGQHGQQCARDLSENRVKTNETPIDVSAAHNVKPAGGAHVGTGVGLGQRTALKITH